MATVRFVPAGAGSARGARGGPGRAGATRPGAGAEGAAAGAVAGAPASRARRSTGSDRAEPLARLRAWVEQVYRPGYGHLAATLAPCWTSHDLCLYGLDILSGLWSVLYLQPERTPRMLSAQAEYQARILPALADQLRLETARCGHPRTPAGYPRSRP